MSTEIKICGLTQLEDALKAVELGADYLGFILYEKSPRYIQPAKLALLVAGLPAGTKCVGVFVNSPAEEVISIADKCSLSVLQMHGDEDLRELPAMPLPLWKAVRVAPGTTELPDDAEVAERVLLDTSVEGLYGGTGRDIDLEAAAVIAQQAPVMLAGGMNPENVAGAVRQVRPLGVDVASGVEASPGIKDHTKMIAFFDAVRSV